MQLCHVVGWECNVAQALNVSQCTRQRLLGAIHGHAVEGRPLAVDAFGTVAGERPYVKFSLLGTAKWLRWWIKL